MSNEVPKITPKFCGDCGQKLLEGATFCAYCGAQLPKIASDTVPVSKISSEYTTIPPSTAHIGVPSDTPRYPAEEIRKEPALPFIQHFQGVLTSPQLEMVQIAKRPNLSQPALIVMMGGILAGMSFFLLASRLGVQFSNAFYQSMGIMAMSTEVTYLFLSFSFFVAFIIFNWIAGILIIWILLTILSNQVPSHERDFKTVATIAGWALIPQIFNELLQIAYIILLIPSSTNSVDDLFELTDITTLSSIGDFWLLIFIADLIFLIWRVVLIYFAVKSIDPEGVRAVIIGGIYAVFIFFFG